MPRIRMKISIAGTFWNLVEGVKVGDIVDMDNDAEAQRMISLGYAELANQGKPERPPEPKEERATAPKSETAVTKPKVEEKPAPKPGQRGPGRPRNT